MKILFTGGGTAGHIMPIVAIVREMKRLHTQDDVKIFYMGPKDAESLLVLQQEGVKTFAVVTGKIRRYFSFQNFVDILINMPVGFIQSFFILLFNRPQLVFSKGGTGSNIVALAARILMIPIFLHESDAAPGMSNRAVSAFAQKIFISFPKTEYFDPAKTTLVGNPVKKELFEGSLNDARERFNLTLEKPVLLFLGGSQGAAPLNDFVLSALDQLIKNYEIIHVCGKNNYQAVIAEVKARHGSEAEKYYHAKPFLGEVELKHALAAASLVISRSGSSGIFEIAGAGKPSILVPLPGSSFDHQSKNAYQYAGTGAAEVIEQQNLTTNFFIGKAEHIISNPEAFKTAALQFSKPLAGKAIAREILEFLQK